MAVKNEPYDLIGDIHGEAEVLRALLDRLGYKYRGGAYRHANRRVIFLGDYVDRGPAIRETLHIVRDMVDHGSALALCGNHELSVLLHDTPDGLGGWLRPHGGRHTAMHAGTHADFASHAEEWQEWLRWFQTLPIYLELPGLRAVHACWDEKMIAALGERRLDDAFLHEIARRETPAAKAVHRLLKGPEVPLPPGVEIAGRRGKRMWELRGRWWIDGRGDTYRNACINCGEPGPAIAIAPEYNDLLTPRHDDRLPIFIGHYWLPPAQPAPLTPTIACLDYSVAGGGPLVAYRWDGERTLQVEKFVFDPARLPGRLVSEPA